MMQNTTRVLCNDGGAKGLYGEDGTTECLCRAVNNVDASRTWPTDAAARGVG